MKSIVNAQLVERVLTKLGAATPEGWIGSRNLLHSQVIELGHDCAPNTVQRVVLIMIHSGRLTTEALKTGKYRFRLVGKP